MPHLQRSKWLIFMIVALAHYPVFCRTFGADFEHPARRGGCLSNYRVIMNIVAKNFVV